MRIFTTLMTALLVSLSVSAGNVELKKMSPKAAQPASEQSVTEGKTVTLTKVVAAYFQRDNEVSGYYIVLADNENATYNASTATINARNCNIVTLDLYSQRTATAVLESDTFTPSTGVIESGNYKPEYTYSAFYNFAGSEAYWYDIDGNISVTRLDNENNYHIEFADANGTKFVFEGHINFLNSNASSLVYPQIQADINTTFTGGMAFYNGNAYESNTGNMFINLFDCEFDSETGAMPGTGINLALCAFTKLYGNPAAATIEAGVYTVASNFGVGTYYPGMEVTYDGTTIVFGSYVRRRKAVTGEDSDYDFTYINNGTVTVEVNEDGTYNFDVDLVTGDGFKVTGTATNININIIDASDDNEVHISNLEEDVVMDLNYIKTARVYNNGVQSGCRRFLLDIGSPSGKDGTEGDIFRMELLARNGELAPPMGVYSVMQYDHNYTNLYEPFKAVQGYFTDGGLDGTRYEHFEEGRYNVMDLLAPAVYGTISIQQVEGTENYHFIIDVIDDAGFSISGEWTGPMELLYSPESVGVESIFGDKKLVVHYIDRENIALDNLEGNELVNLYAPDGRLVFSQMGASQICLSGLSNGMYILKIDNYESVKIIKK